MDTNVQNPSEAPSKPPPPASSDPQSAKPPPRKKAKLEPATQGLLTEIFALQDTISDIEAEALARKVKCARTLVNSLFKNLKSSVDSLVDRSMKRTPGFHKVIKPAATGATPPPSAADQDQSPPQQGPEQQPVLGQEAPDKEKAAKTILEPLTGAEVERVALQLVSKATNLRHTVTATLAPLLAPGGGLKDSQAATELIVFAGNTTKGHSPPFSHQLQFLDAIIATKEKGALATLRSSSTLPVILPGLVSSCLKEKHYTLVMRALHALRVLDNPKSVPKKSRFELRALINDSHGGVKEAAKKLAQAWGIETERESPLGGVEVVEKVAPAPAARPPPPQQQQQQQAARPAAPAPPRPPSPPPPVFKGDVYQGMQAEITFYRPPDNLTTLEVLRNLPEDMAADQIPPQLRGADPPTIIPFVPTDPVEFTEQNDLMIDKGITSPAYVSFSGAPNF